MAIMPVFKPQTVRFNYCKENSHFDLSIVSIPEKLDPDEYVRKYGAEAFQNLANHGRETVLVLK